MAVTVYPESCKVTLGEKAGAEEIGEYLAGIVEENRRPPIEVSRTAEDFRNRLYIQMVNADVNRELLKDADVLSEGGYGGHCQMPGRTGGRGCLFLPCDKREPVSISDDRGGGAGAGNIENTAPAGIFPDEHGGYHEGDVFCDGICTGRCGSIGRMIKENPSPLYILTNEERLNGANALVCPQVLQDAYETLGEPYYVLPSSTHEVLLVKESEGSARRNCGTWCQRSISQR